MSGNTLWLGLLKSMTAVAWDKIKSVTIDVFYRQRARYKAFNNEELISSGSLYSLINNELEKLTKDRELPYVLQNELFISWLLQPDTTELFIRAIITRSGHNYETVTHAESSLVDRCENFTNETRVLITERINIAIQYVYGQLTATESGKQKFELALLQWVAAHPLGLADPDSPLFPSDKDLKQIKSMAEYLLEAGKRSWKMPRFVAPLTLNAHICKDGQEEACPTNPAELSAAIEEGINLTLYGEGGIGKTTFLLDLCTSCLNMNRRIPIYVDAADWARSSKNLYDYITSQPPALEKGVTSADLAKLAVSGHLALMINGWNEMFPSSKLVCRNSLIQLTTAAKALSVVVVSRTSIDTPGLHNPMQVEVRGLTWSGQTAVIRAELSDNNATPLLDILTKNTPLRHAARSPLILRGLIAQANKGVAQYSSVFDLLGASVQAFEEDDQRRSVLADAPVYDLQVTYLEEIACKLTNMATTGCSREEALQSINSASDLLASRQVISLSPQPVAVLEILVSHHLLHLENGIVRFVHQRFQEYFAANKLLREYLNNGSQSFVFIRSALNLSSWYQSLLLTATKLKEEESASDSRVKLIQIASTVDLGLACDLAGICGFNGADDLDLHRQLVTQVNNLIASPLAEVKDLGISYLISSRFLDFSEYLWQLLVSDNQQNRLKTYRMNATPISVMQLGPEAIQRLSSWPPEKKLEFIHEIAENPDNYDFLLFIAEKEPNPSVRAGAISTLLWNFPASDLPFKLWLNAPVEVQKENNILSLIKEYLQDEGEIFDRIRDRFKIIVENHLDDQPLIQFTYSYEIVESPHLLENMLSCLRKQSNLLNYNQLIESVRSQAPDRLLALAQDMVLQNRNIPIWVGKYLFELPPESKHLIFEKAWDALHGLDFEKMNVETLGPLANKNQIARCVDLLLEFEIDNRGKLSEVDIKRNRQLAEIIKNVSGSLLMDVVQKRGVGSSYKEATTLVGLVVRRIGGDLGIDRDANKWLPTLDETREFVIQFVDKTETGDNPQDTVRIYLCCIASQVAPDEFKDLLMDTTRRHLDAWGTYQTRLSNWIKDTSQPRPMNPQNGLYITSALARWGFDAIPCLIELGSHPCSMELIPCTISKIVSSPWASKKDQIFNDLNSDILEGNQRGNLGFSLKQPNVTYQTPTDQAANYLGSKLDKIVSDYLKQKVNGEKWNPREAEFRLGQLAGFVANIPSSNVVVPLSHALSSGLMNVFGILGAVRGLLRQGVFNLDPSIVSQIERLLEEAENKQWNDESTRHSLSELCKLMFFLESNTQLSKPTTYYLKLWRKFSYPSDIIQQLGDIQSESSWLSILELWRELENKDQSHNHLLNALVSALTPRNLTIFNKFIADRTLNTWCNSAWTLEKLTPKIAKIFLKVPDKINDFLDACRQAQSPLTDMLASETLFYMKDRENIRQKYLLDALDAGRAIHPNMSVFHLLLKMFKEEIPIGESQYKVAPKANNELRTQLYSRAKCSDPIADGCRMLLASLECDRRESERPDDESRHPMFDEENSWTNVLVRFS